jgi:hypothetical protein
MLWHHRKSAQGARDETLGAASDLAMRAGYIFPRKSSEAKLPAGRTASSKSELEEEDPVRTASTESDPTDGAPPVRRPLGRSASTQSDPTDKGMRARKPKGGAKKPPKILESEI